MVPNREDGKPYTELNLTLVICSRLIYVVFEKMAFCYLKIVLPVEDICQTQILFVRTT